MTGIFRTTNTLSALRPRHIDNGASALASGVGRRSNTVAMSLLRILGDPSSSNLTARLRETDGDRAVAPLSSATRADFDQTIKPYVILLNSLGQSVLVRVA